MRAIIQHTRRGWGSTRKEITGEGGGCEYFTISEKEFSRSECDSHLIRYLHDRSTSEFAIGYDVDEYLAAPSIPTLSAPWLYCIRELIGHKRVSVCRSSTEQQIVLRSIVWKRSWHSIQAAGITNDDDTPGIQLVSALMGTQNSISGGAVDAGMILTIAQGTWTNNIVMVKHTCQVICPFTQTSLLTYLLCIQDTIRKWC